MNKLFFRNDYGEGAHPVVMQKLLETNMEHTCGYGLDDYSLRAADLIREKCGNEVDMVVPTGTVIGAHSGPGTMALFFVGSHR